MYSNPQSREHGMIMEAGVYSITDKAGRQYVGSSFNIEKRWYRHLYSLKKNAHANRFLQRSYNKYGEVSLSFKRILICAKEDLLFFEQLILDTFKPELNLCSVAGSPMAGRKHSAEAKRRMSAARIGVKRNYPTTRKPHSKETRNKMRHARGRPVLCVELNLTFDFVSCAAAWCVQRGLTASSDGAKNINRAIRLKTPTVFGYHWRALTSME